MGPHRILLDCGLTDLTSLIKAAGGKAPADVVLCSHAHPDHARGLLALHRAFPQLPIYASEVTTQLMWMNWLEEEKPIQQFCHALPWRSPLEFATGLSATLYPAGHLPGAAAILLTYTSPQRPYTLFYTGDFLLSNSRLVEGLPLEELRGLKPNVLIVEASYGTARHPHRRQQENSLAERILAAIANQHSVLFPAPTIGLGQELLMLLRSHHQFTGRNLDIWVDGSVATGCDAYLDLLDHFPSSVQNFARHQPLFWDDRVRPRVRRLPEETGLRRIALSGQTPCILIADETAAFQQYISLSNLPWLMLLPQQPGRVGAIEPAIYQAIRSSSPLRSALKAGRLTVDTYLLSEHCDGPGTTQLIHNLRPQHVVLFHGPDAYLADLAGLEELQNRYQLHIASVGTLVELPIGETFAQPAPPESRYEGEVVELQDSVMITLPDGLLSDPRWQTFSETGVVEARWQGEELVIKGITPRELFSRSDELTLAENPECCGACLHFRGQRCWNQDSPLFGFRVTPDGYCPAFEAIALQQEPPLLDEEEGDDEVLR
ncbi:MAG TPA: MBL fold metallo-hydrolase [Synechococcales cyanobacterium M55_K2018_004]|nr:MBL fold metallo-hydrolase [Synechococcales cyanobacterium M55_K2018_004]